VLGFFLPRRIPYRMRRFLENPLVLDYFDTIYHKPTEAIAL